MTGTLFALPLASLEPLARRFGLEANLLSALLALPRGDGDPSPELARYDEDALKTALHAVWQPVGLCVLALLAGDRVAEHVLLHDGDGLWLAGMDDGVLRLAQAGDDDIATLAERYFPGGRAPAADVTRLALPDDAAAVWLAMTDDARRRRLDAVLRHRVAEGGLDAAVARHAWEEAAEEEDLRWLLSLAQRAAFPVPTPDLEAGVRQLAEKDLLLESDGRMIATETGMRLLDAMAGYMSAGAVKSVFCQDGALTSTVSLFLGADGRLWHWAQRESGTELVTRPFDDVRTIWTRLATPERQTAAMSQPNPPPALSSPPDSAGKEQVEQAPLSEPPPAESASPTYWSCSCGRNNQGRFCPRCGAPREHAAAVPASSPPSTGDRVCRHCGAAVGAGASFCARCGKQFAR